MGAKRARRSDAPEHQEPPRPVPFQAVPTMTGCRPRSPTCVPPVRIFPQYGRSSVSIVQALRCWLMDLIIGFGNRARRQQAVLGYRPARGGISPVDLRHVDATIDHDGSDMNALRSEFPCHALCDRARAELGRGEGGELRTTAHRRGRAGEYHRPWLCGNMWRTASRPNTNAPKQPSRQTFSNVLPVMSSSGLRCCAPAL